jgi:hypothetical protein
VNFVRIGNPFFELFLLKKRLGADSPSAAAETPKNNLGYGKLATNFTNLHELKFLID